MTTEQLTERYLALNGHVMAFDESLKSLSIRLSTVEKDNEEHRQILVFIERLTNHMSTITEKVNSLDEKFDAFGCRVSTLEMRPATLWDKGVAFFLGAVIAGIVTFASNILFK